MAILACAGRLNVDCRLTSRYPAVMAAEAIRGDRAMVDMNRLPRRCPMAVGADGTGCRVVFRLAGCQITVVTALAGSWHALEDSTCVASLTCNLPVGSIQFKASCGMVEITIDLDGGIHLLGQRLRQGEQHHREYNRDGPQHCC